MSLETGTTLGPYSVTAKIGEGGMGEVYRARDTKLHRDVALKVLPRAFADDPDRLARFEREAKVLAALNHPNIGALYELERSGDTRALVRERSISSWRRAATTPLSASRSARRSPRNGDRVTCTMQTIERFSD